VVLRIFKNAWFGRFARREKIKDAVLKDAIARAERGIIDAELGGGVIKQRIARPGQGRSGGYRSIIIFQKGERAIFVYGFAKSDREDIEPDELVGFKKLAKEWFTLSDQKIDAMIKNQELTEIGP
jgi:hypothetical protein